jgi:hypothetical protein
MYCVFTCTLYIQFMKGKQRELFLDHSNLTSAGILKQSMWARNRVGTGLQYRPDRLHRLADLIPCHRFLGFLNV